MIQNVVCVINIFYTAAICWQMNNMYCWWRGCKVSHTNYHDYDLNLSELTSWHLEEDLQKAGSRTCYKFFPIWLLLNWWEYTSTSNAHHKSLCCDIATLLQILVYIIPHCILLHMKYCFLLFYLYSCFKNFYTNLKKISYTFWWCCNKSSGVISFCFLSSTQIQLA